MHVTQISFGEDQPGPPGAGGAGSNLAIPALWMSPLWGRNATKPSAPLAPPHKGETRPGCCVTIPISGTIGPATPARQGAFPSRGMSQAANQGTGSARPPHASPKGNREPVLPQSSAGRGGSPTGKGSVTPQSVPVLLWDFGPSQPLRAEFAEKRAAARQKCWHRED